MLHSLVLSGKVRMLGASNWTAQRIKEANDFARANGMTPFATRQIFWNGAKINEKSILDQTLICMNETEHEGYKALKMPVMAYTSQAQGLFSHIAQKGFDGISDALKRDYLNDVTRRRAERILAISKETGISPTAISLTYLLEDEVKAIPIAFTSNPHRIDEIMQVYDVPKGILHT